MKKRRSLRQLDARFAVQLDRAQHDLETDGFLRIAPNRKGEAPAGAKHAVRLDERGLRSGEMKNAEVHRRGVEQSAAHRQLLGVALAKLDTRV